MLADMAIKCWGTNDEGQLGLGDVLARGNDGDETGDDLPTVSLGAGRTAVAIDSGDFHTCVLLDDASAKCWGSNGSGQLGQEVEDSLGDDAFELGNALPPIDLGTGRTAAQISAAGSHTCAVLDDESMKCWGQATRGQLGQENADGIGRAADEMGDDLDPIDLGTGRSAGEIATGGDSSCAILDDESLKCWGHNFDGKLGRGDEVDWGLAPDQMGDDLDTIDLGTGRSAAAVAVGKYFTCAVRDDDSLTCWGDAVYGQLGQGDRFDIGDGGGEMGDALDPVDLGTGRTASVLKAGGFHACAILDNNQLKCWGWNREGQLGQGDDDSRGDGLDEMGDDLDAVDLGAGRTATSIAAGERHTCAVLDDASVKCWGYNRYGQLGQGHADSLGDDPNEMGDDLPIVDLGTGRTATATSAGSSHTCAILDNGSVKCWGRNSSGQLGQGHTSSMGDGMEEMGDLLPVVDGVDIADVDARPGQPAAPTVVAGAEAATVTWSAVPDDGGSTVTVYVVESSVDGVSWTEAGSTGAMSLEVTGLAAGVSIQFRVQAVNAIGAGPQSWTSPAVEPLLDFDPCPAGGHPFTDVPESSFAFDDVGCIFQLGITTGTSATTYGPGNLVTREQMAAFLGRVWRALGFECPAGGHPFTDVTEASFAFDDVGCIFQLGITTGTSATTYGPVNLVTREQMAAFLGRVWRAMGFECPGGGHPFTDVPESSFAFDDVGCIFQLGITTGTSATTYGPADFVTREQMAAFLGRLLRKAAEALGG